MCTYVCEIFVCFGSYLFVRPPFEQKLNGYEGRLVTLVGVWARSGQCVARGGRSIFFSAGVDMTYDDFPGFLLDWRHCFVFRNSLFFQMLCFLLPRISLKTAPFGKTLGFLCRDSFGVYYHPSLGRLRAVCRVSRMHAPCLM